MFQTSFRVKMNADNFSLAGELTTMLAEEPLTNSELGLIPTTEQSFFKPNLTLQKFFNVSIPIKEKINIYIIENNNLTHEVNKLDIIPPIHPSTRQQNQSVNTVFRPIQLPFVSLITLLPPASSLFPYPRYSLFAILIPPHLLSLPPP